MRAARLHKLSKEGKEREREKRRILNKSSIREVRQWTPMDLVECSKEQTSMTTNNHRFSSRAVAIR